MTAKLSLGARYADCSPSARQEYLKTLVVEYRGLTEVLRKIGMWHMPVNGGVHATGSCHVLLGEHRAGKSFALKQYCDRFSSYFDEEARARITRVLYVETAALCTPRDLAIALNEALCDGPVSLKKTVNAQEELNKFLLALQLQGVELIIFDDAQNLIVNNKRYSIFFKDFICRILNRNCCGVILAGNSSVYDAVEIYAPLAGRGALPNFTIPALKWSVEAEQKEFIHFCKELDRRLPFREPSLLGDQTIALHLFFASKGLVGRLCNYVRDAAHMAINDNADSIQLKHLEEAALDRHRPGSAFTPFFETITPTMIQEIELAK